MLHSLHQIYFYPRGNTLIYSFAAHAHGFTGQKSIQSAFAQEMQQVVGRPCSSAFLSTGSSIFRRVWHFLRQLEIEGVEPSPRCVVSPRRASRRLRNVPTVGEGELTNRQRISRTGSGKHIARVIRPLLSSGGILFDRCVFRLFREIVEGTPLITAPAGA